MIFGKPNFDDLTFTINDAVFRYGSFITAVITFVAIAAAVFFFVVKPIDVQVLLGAIQRALGLEWIYEEESAAPKLVVTEALAVPIPTEHLDDLHQLGNIGYVRGICRNDRPGRYVTGRGNEIVELPEGATDASLTPYHIERGKLFVRERFAKNHHIEVEVLCANIEYTRFPVPLENEGEAPSEYPALLRASDLIGQLADLSYMRKIAALYIEFEETGANKKLGYASSADLRAAYPNSFGRW